MCVLNTEVQRIESESRLSEEFVGAKGSISSQSIFGGSIFEIETLGLESPQAPPVSQGHIRLGVHFICTAVGTHACSQ